MSPLVQQRLIGSILLLGVLSGLAFFLINSANDDMAELITEEAEAETPFVSSIDAIVTDNSGIEVIEDEPETLVIPQQLIEPEQENTASSSAINESEPTSEAVTESTTVETWSLQLASFSIQASADSLRKQVEMLGYKATIEKAETSNGDVFRVRIGPEQDKLVLEAASKALKDKLNLQSQILKQ